MYLVGLVGCHFVRLFMEVSKVSRKIKSGTRIYVRFLDSIVLQVPFGDCDFFASCVFFIII